MKLLSKKQVAEALGVDPKKLDEWRQSDRFAPAHATKSGQKRYTAAQVEEFLNSTDPTQPVALLDSDFRIVEITLTCDCGAQMFPERVSNGQNTTRAIDGSKTTFNQRVDVDLRCQKCRDARALGIKITKEVKE